MKLVVKIKLVTTQEQASSLHEVMFAYNDACNFVSRYAFKTQVFNNFSLHHALYKQLIELSNQSCTVVLRIREPAFGMNGIGLPGSHQTLQS